MIFGTVLHLFMLYMKVTNMVPTKYQNMHRVGDKIL
jgi:hypothetical protein